MSQENCNLEILTPLNITASMMNSKNISMSDSFIDNLQEVFNHILPLSLYGKTKQSLEVDTTIDLLKKNLISIIDSIPYPDKRKIVGKIIRILCQIGITRGSIDDILTVVKLMATFETDIDIYDVVQQIRNLPELCKNDFPIQSDVEDELIISNIKNSDNTSSATDGKYLYYYSSNIGIVTIGLGNFSIKRIFYGKINCKYIGKNITLFLLKNALYCWYTKQFFRLIPNTLCL